MPHNYDKGAGAESATLCCHMPHGRNPKTAADTPPQTAPTASVALGRHAHLVGYRVTKEGERSSGDNNTHAVAAAPAAAAISKYFT